MILFLYKMIITIIKIIKNTIPPTIPPIIPADKVCEFWVFYDVFGVVDEDDD